MSFTLEKPYTEPNKKNLKKYLIFTILIQEKEFKTENKTTFFRITQRNRKKP